MSDDLVELTIHDEEDNFTGDEETLHLEEGEIHIDDNNEFPPLVKNYDSGYYESEESECEPPPCKKKRLVDYSDSEEEKEEPVKIGVCLTSKYAKIPTKATSDSAAHDLYADQRYGGRNWYICPGGKCKIATGVKFEIPPGYCGKIFARSGHAHRGLELSTGVSIIDSDYKKTVFVPVKNTSTETKTVKCGERFAQIMFEKLQPIQLQAMTCDEVKKGEDEENSNVRKGGFGHTGRF